MASGKKSAKVDGRFARAELNYFRSSARKVRLVVDMLRGKKVGEALHILTFTQKNSARSLAKLLRSVVAVAMQKDSSGSLDVDSLYLSQAFVNEGPIMKRFRPRAMGRGGKVLKRSCHVVFEVSK